jgi:hypothetical protein
MLLTSKANNVTTRIKKAAEYEGRLDMSHIFVHLSLALLFFAGT